MNKGIRSKLWDFVASYTEEGSILPKWAIIIRMIIYPLDTFYHLMNDKRGYNPIYNVWNLHGITYSDQALKALSEADGEIYRIHSDGNNVTVERLSEYTSKSKLEVK